jgi:hypothetical protein
MSLLILGQKNVMAPSLHWLVWSVGLEDSCIKVLPALTVLVIINSHDFSFFCFRFRPKLLLHKEKKKSSPVSVEHRW